MCRIILVRLRRRGLFSYKGLLSYSLESRGLFTGLLSYTSEVEDYLQDYSRTPPKKRIIFMQRIIDRIILLQTLVRLRRRELLPCKGLLTGLFSYSLESRGLFQDYVRTPPKKRIIFKGLLAGLFLRYNLESRGLFTGFTSCSCCQLFPPGSR